jgi:Flp pilus assembly protein CpaB
MTTPSELAAKLPQNLGWRRLLSTRKGTIALAGLAALASLGILLVFMSNYRSSVQSGAADTRVLVADQLIDAKTPGGVIAEAGLFKPVAITEDEALEGAITDPAALEGQVVTEPIYSGQQITAAALAPGADPITGHLTGTQRALTVPVESAQGNIGQIEAGSRVDILGGFNAEVTGGRARPVLDTLATDVLVLRVPESGGGAVSDDESQIVLRVDDVEARQIAFAADAGDLWVLVRPPTLAKDSNTNAVQLESLLGQGTAGVGG